MRKRQPWYNSTTTYLNTIGGWLDDVLIEIVFSDFPRRGASSSRSFRSDARSFPPRLNSAENDRLKSFGI